MTKIDVLDIISREHLVEKIVYKLLLSSKNPFDCPEDLIQDVYIMVYDKDENLIVDLYNKGELGYYLLRIIRNQLLSTHSCYYYKYIKFRAQSDDLESAKNISQEDRRGV